MPKWLAVAHVVIEAESEEEANTVVAAKLAERLSTAEGWQQEADATPRYTVINVERLPDDAESTE